MTEQIKDIEIASLKELVETYKKLITGTQFEIDHYKREVEKCHAFLEVFQMDLNKTLK